MAALVENMFSVREVPWHKLGTVVSEAPNSKEAIKLAGLDWNVTQHDIRDDESGEVISGFKANIREIDGKVLGIVSDRYKICQNSEAFDFTDELLGSGEVKYETAGSLMSGKRIWLLARMTENVIEGEDYVPYLVFTNAHDGSGSIKAAITPVRVVCNNTLNLALSGAKRTWSCDHRGDISGKIEEAAATLGFAEKYMNQFKSEILRLKTAEFSVKSVENAIKTLVPIDEKWSNQRVNNAKALRLELWHRYNNAPDLSGLDHTKFRFINAVSDFATHSGQHKNTQTYEENRFMRTIDGHKLIDFAYKITKEAV